MSSTPSILAVLPQHSFDATRQAPVPERAPASAPAGSIAADHEASAVSLSPQAMAQVRAEARAAVLAVGETFDVPAQDAALMSTVQAAGIDTGHHIFSHPSSRLDALGLAVVAISAQPEPERAMSLLEAFSMVMQAPLNQIEPKTPPTDPIVRQMKMAQIRESLVPPFADVHVRLVIDAYLQRYLAMNPEIAAPAETDAAAAGTLATTTT